MQALPALEGGRPARPLRTVTELHLIILSPSGHTAVCRHRCASSCIAGWNIIYEPERRTRVVRLTIHSASFSLCWLPLWPPSGRVCLKYCTAAPPAPAAAVSLTCVHKCPRFRFEKGAGPGSVSK